MMMTIVILNVKSELIRFPRMGYSKEDKAESHERIVRAAASRFREVGVDGIGVADLMKEAGLTHGGFYRHFASREDLVAEGIERALHDGAKGAFDAEANTKLDRQALLFALVDWYLSTGHRDGLATSCAVASLAGDVSRSNDRARAAYTRQVGAYLELFVRLMAGEKPKKAKRAKAVAAWATLVGAVSMARAVNDEKLSREILKTAADELKAQLG
jgi:TetR/AcrR family transcriptional regulator, transcriptional repressor for nem operon